jgi:hypothetical protein
MGFFSRVKEQMREKVELNREQKQLEHEAYKKEKLRLAPRYGKVLAQREYKDSLKVGKPQSAATSILNSMGSGGSGMGGNAFGSFSGHKKSKNRIFP